MIAGIHIEPTNICTLKCSGCARTRFINQWPQHWRNHSVDVDAVMKFLDIDLTGLLIILCGNYGDPIYHPDFINLVTQLKARGARLLINTNGSYRTKEWWDDLVSKLATDDIICFAIDGTPENFTQYRVNADWASIEIGIKSAVAGLCRTVWKYIPFSYNQTDIEATETLSQQLGIDEFLVEPSDRFDDTTEYLKPSEELIGNRYFPQNNWKKQQGNSVDPKCRQQRDHYISAEGYYVSCCYLADHRFYYKTPFGKKQSEYSIKNHTLTEILNTPATIKFYSTLDQQPGCQYNCPKLVTTNLT